MSGGGGPNIQFITETREIEDPVPLKDNVTCSNSPFLRKKTVLILVLEPSIHLEHCIVFPPFHFHEYVK